MTASRDFQGSILSCLVALVVASWTGGCSSKSAIPCNLDSTCAPYGATCVDHECRLPSGTDLGAVDLRAVDLAPAAPDLAADLSSAIDLSLAPDLASLLDLGPGCGVGQSCPASMPICGSGDVCRACVLADHAACAAGNVLTPRCDEGTGACAACRSNEASDCSDVGFSVCGSDGSCRQPCTAHADCASGICDPGIVTAGKSSCARADEVVYVTAASACAGNHAGTSADPFCTLDAAIAKLPNGGFIRASSGTSVLGGAATALTKPYVIVGAATVNGATVFGATPAALTVHGGGRLYVEGLTFTNANGPAITCDGTVGAGGASITLQTVTANITKLAAVYATSCSVSLDRVLMENGENGLNQNGGQLLRFTNSVITKNSKPAVYLWAGTSVDGSLVSNLTVTNNVGTGVVGGFVCGSAMNIHNSIVWGNSVASGASSSGTCAFTNSSVDPAVAGSTNNNLQPSFVKHSGPTGLVFDFHLDGHTGNNDACCVNHAAIVAGVATDYDGQARPDGAAPDVGADEI